MSKRRTKAEKPKFICYCNSIPKAQVEAAIQNGADTLGKIFDETTAGCGPCGGSCQPDLKDLLKKAKEKSSS